MGSNTRVRPRRTARDLLSTGDAKSLVDRATCLKNPAWQAVELKNICKLYLDFLNPCIN